MKYQMKHQLTMMLTFLVFVAFSTTVSMADGLVAYWPFDNHVNDIVGDHPGELVNGAEIVNDADRGKVLSVGGGAYVKVEHADDIGFLDDSTATISVWAKPAELPRTGWTTIFTKNRDVHYNNAYGIWISPSNKFHFRFGSTAGDSTADATAEWTHLTLRHDPATTTLHGFVNGQQVYENTNAAEPDLVDSALSIGTALEANLTDTFEEYPGLVDDLAIYNRLLDDAEIEQFAAGEAITAVEPSGKLTTTWGALKH